MKARYLILLAGLACAQMAAAQGYDEDALLISQTTAFGSTARVQGIGGTQISLGGDISSAGSNPAGLGFFNRSVFSLTPAVNLHNADGIYNGNLNTTFRPNFNMPNLGVVLNHNFGDYANNDFKGGSFAISATRINDFNQQYSYNGTSAATSIVDFFAQDAGNIIEDDLPELPYGAFQTFLISPEFTGDQISRYKTLNESEPDQSETVTTSGGQNQLNLAWGGNYKDKVYFGGGIGVQTIRYKRERYYKESDFFYEGQSAGYQPINQIVLSDELTLDGAGINASFGMIARPVSFLTLGVAYTTPTYFAMSSEYKFDLSADWNSFQFDDDNFLDGNQSYPSAILTNDYTIKTPGKLALGSSFFVGKQGFISADVEFVDYGDMLLQSSDVEVNLDADNQTILRKYTSVINYKVGGEYRLDAFRFRVGYAYFGDPYKNGSMDRSRQNLTFGAGLRQRDFFLDFAVVKTYFDQAYSPYYLSNMEDQPMVKVRNDNTSISATLGFNF